MDKNYQHHPRYSPTMLIPIQDCPGEQITPFTFKPWQKRNVPGVMSILLRRKMDQVNCHAAIQYAIASEALIEKVVEYVFNSTLPGTTRAS